MNVEQDDFKNVIKFEKTSLGIELGSTRIKAALIDDQFETIATGYYEWENTLQDGFWTYDFSDVVVGLQTAYQNLKQQVENRYGVVMHSVGSIGISAMMHGYLILDRAGVPLVPFRTWRNATTRDAAKELTDVFQFNIPERWSIAHLYQAVLNKEDHLPNIDFMTTLAGYVHWLLTGERRIGIGDASGMFPIDASTHDYNQTMVDTFAELTQETGAFSDLRRVLPKICVAGERAGELTDAGANILDVSGHLTAGIPLCPPEGDAGTGMIATNSIRQRTGNISVGTSIFSMMVLEENLKALYPEIDLVTTPDGNPVAMVHANNGSNDIDAWMSIFREFSETIGYDMSTNQLFELMLNKALEADSDGGGLLSYGYFSGENITHLEEGRPLFVRSPKSNFNLANFMRTHLFTTFGALKIGMDILNKQENVAIDRMLAHGGLFKTPGVAQKMVAAAINAPVSVMATAGEGGAWGMAILASFMLNKAPHEPLTDFLDQRVFQAMESQDVYPEQTDVDGFDAFIERYKKGLVIEQTAVNNTVL